MFSVEPLNLYDDVLNVLSGERLVLPSISWGDDEQIDTHNRRTENCIRQIVWERDEVVPGRLQFHQHTAGFHLRECVVLRLLYCLLLILRERESKKNGKIPRHISR